MRIQTFYLLNIQLDQSSRYKSPEEMMPFSWEAIKEKPVYILNQEDWNNLQKVYVNGA